MILGRHVSPALHAEVLGEDLGEDAVEAPVPPNRDQAGEQLAADPAAQERVAHVEGELGLAGERRAQQAPHRDQLAFALGDEGHLAVVIDEADAGEPVVGHSRVELDGQAY